MAAARRSVADEVVLDLLEGVVPLVADELVRRVHPLVEDRVVEVGVVDVALPVVDRRPVEQRA